MSNLHSEQTGTQLHKPQKHSSAPQNSVLTKTKDNTVGYVEGLNSHSTVITPTSDVGGVTNNKYFSIYSKQLSKLFCVWYNVDTDGTLTLPDGYDQLIEVAISSGDNVESIIDDTVAALNSVSSAGNYVLYDSATDNTTNLTLVQTNSPAVIDGNTGWTFITTDTASSVDKALISKGTTGKLEFSAFPTAATNAFSTIDCPSGTDPVADSDTDTLTLTAGTGIAVTGNSGTDSIEFACNLEGTEVASTGVTGTTKFLRVDGDNTCSWQIPSYTVTADTQTHLISESFRFSTNNLFVGEGLKYTFQGENTTKGGMIVVAIDPTAFTSPQACRAMIYIRPDGGTSYTISQIAGIMTGTSGATVVLRIYKGSPCAGTSFVGTEVANGTFALQGSTQHICDDFAILGEGTELLTSHQVLIMTLECSEEIEDLDSRGQITMEIVKVP